MVKACVLFAAGTNCDAEAMHAFELAGASPERVHINELKSGERKLSEFQILMIPGGFSYGDYIASGRILANELRFRLKDDLLEFHHKKLPILGVCNGFQVLVKAGMLPAAESLFEPQSVTLDTNESGKFEDRWVWLRTQPTDCIFTKDLPEVIELPVAHAEGRFVAGSPALSRLNAGRQVVFRYVSPGGDEASYPENPNGSIQAIAGICDSSGLVFGLMPHPERFVRREQHPRWHREPLTTPVGIRIFENAVKYCS